MIKLKPFTLSDFEMLISWIDNQEMLVTIAGNYFSYPLNTTQLKAYLEDDSSYSFNIVDAIQSKVIGHAELVSSGNDIFKIDKFLIGNPSNRGKGIGQQVINELLTYAFTLLQANKVELNVFDWNTLGIMCYEKCGFIFNPGKQASFEMNGKRWIVLNMIIEKDNWLKKISDK